MEADTKDSLPDPIQLSKSGSSDEEVDLLHQISLSRQL
jgi:hypothetical protein